MNANLMRFSIVIVHRNGAPMLLATLAALHLACDLQRDEILLIDNHSSDDSVNQALSQHPHLSIIRNTCNNGFARACNQGISQAHGEFVLLLNNDAQPAPDVLARIEQVFREHPTAAVVAAQLLDEQGQPQRSFGRIPTMRDEIGLFRAREPYCREIAPDVLETESVIGACMAVRMAAIRQAGALDDDFFFYFEETEWCYRLRQHGWLVMLARHAKVLHLKGASTRGLRVGAQIEMLRSRLTFYRKTLPPIQARLLTILRVLRLLLNTLSHLLAVVLTLGLVTKLRQKLKVYATLIIWLALGKPESWGLPDKCPHPRKSHE